MLKSDRAWPGAREALLISPIRRLELIRLKRPFRSCYAVVSRGEALTLGVGSPSAWSTIVHFRSLLPTLIKQVRVIAVSKLESLEDALHPPR